MEHAIPGLFLTVWAALGLGTWLFLRRLSPKAKKYWHPRLAVLAIVAMAPFLLGALALWRNWLGLAVGALALAGLTYLNVTKIRICEQCGKTIQPPHMVRAADFCPHCGAALSPFRWSDPKPSTGGGGGGA